MPNSLLLNIDFFCINLEFFDMDEVERI